MMTFSETGGLITVPAGAGYLGVQPTVLVSREAPNGVQVFIRDVFCHAMDIDLSQISFAFLRNGASLISGLTFIPATMFVSGSPIRVQELMPTGHFNIVAYNLSGTGLTNAIAAVACLCQASWNGHVTTINNALSFTKNPGISSLTVKRGFLT